MAKNPDIQLMDFDAQFSEYLNQWIEKNQHKYKRPEDMEDEMPGVYLKFLNTPASWLEGATPGEYFNRYESAQELCALLRAYAQGEVPVPDTLLDRLAELNEEPPLMDLAADTAAPCEARMLAIDLLRQLDSTAPMVEYLRWQVDRSQEEDLLDSALESLRAMGDAVRGPAKTAFLAAPQAGKEALLDVLCDFPGDDGVFAFTLECFKTQRDKRALYAGYLAKLDDDRALEALLDAAEDPACSYIDFIEIRSAIERLGSEAPVRDFQNDPTYKAVQRLQ